MYSYRNTSRILVILALILPVWSDGNAQSIHLAPPHVSEIEKGEVLMKIQLTPESTLKDTGLSITDDQIIVHTGDGNEHLIPLVTRTIRDIELELEDLLSQKVNITSLYPGQQATLLDNRTTVILSSLDKDTLELKARGTEPQVILGFGSIFSLGEGGTDGNNNLLESSGFQFDLAGVHRLSQGDGSYKPSLFLTAHLGLGADTDLLVEDGEADETGQFSSVLSQADVLHLTAAFNFIWARDPNFDLGITFGGGVSWANPEQFTFPSQLRLNDTTFVSTAKYVNENEIERVTALLNRVEPLNELGGMLYYRFKNGGEPAFYIGAGLYTKEIIAKRGFTYQIDTQSSDSIRINSIVTKFKTDQVGVWRLMAGLNVGGIADVRVDAVGALVRGKVEPLLRIAIAKDFPVSKK